MFFTEDRDKYSELIKKFNAIEMLFTLYPPQGAHVRNNVRLKSTWLRPIVNGEEGYRYIGKMLNLIISFYNIEEMTLYISLTCHLDDVTGSDQEVI